MLKYTRNNKVPINIPNKNNKYKDLFIYFVWRYAINITTTIVINYYNYIIIVLKYS